MTAIATVSETPAIRLRGVSKQFGRLTALAGLDLDIMPGRIVGFLGPNGAGKTTTLRILTGFLKPTAGEVRLLGHDLRDAAAAIAARRELGFVPESPGLDPALNGDWLLDHLARLQRRPPVDRERLLERLALSERELRQPIGRLSKGTRQKINLVQALQHRPSLLILDEPAEGLDPFARRALFALLCEARARGATVFCSSHQLADVESLCDEVALIRDGRLLFVDAIDGLRRRLERRVRVEFAPAVDDAGARLAALPGIRDLEGQERHWAFRTADVQPLLALLATLPVADLVIEPPTLEELFLRYYDEAGERDD